MTFKVESNIDDIIIDLEGAFNRLDTTVDDFMEDVMILAVSDIKSQWPVATGTSQAGWSYRKQANKWWILYNDVEYAEFVHDGLAEELVVDAIEDAISSLIEGADFLDV